MHQLQKTLRRLSTLRVECLKVLVMLSVVPSGKNVLIFCDVCKNKFTVDAFSESDGKLYRKLHNMSKFNTLRCRNCCTCPSCGVAKDGRAFKDGETHCKDCAKMHCEVCDEDLPRQAFSSSQIRNRVLGQNPFLRCSKCHTCTRCSEEKTIRAFHKKERQCITCSNQTSSETCDGCRGQKQRDYFDELVLQNARKYGRHKICLLCQDRGLSPMDIQTYPCYGCGQKGHKDFMPNTLYRHKKKKCTTMLCLDCTERRVNIQKALDAKDSLRCTCPGRKKDRCHLPTNKKCNLYASRHMGERQWPGKNKGVTENDLRFMDKFAKQHEYNALKRQRAK